MPCLPASATFWRPNCRHKSCQLFQGDVPRGTRRAGPPPKFCLTPGFWRRRASSSSTTIYPRYVNSSEFFSDHMGSLLCVSRNIFVLRGPLIWRRRADYSSSSTICQEFFAPRGKFFQTTNLLQQAGPRAHPGIIRPNRWHVKKSFADFAAVLRSFLRPGALLSRKVKKKFCANLGKFFLTNRAERARPR